MEIKVKKSGAISYILSLCVLGLICFFTSFYALEIIFRSFNFEVDLEKIKKIVFIICLIFTFLRVNRVLMVLGYGFIFYKIYGYVILNLDSLKNGVKSLLNQSYLIFASALRLPMADGFDDVTVESSYIVCFLLAVIITLFISFLILFLKSKLLYTISLCMFFAIFRFFDLDIVGREFFIIILCYIVYIFYSRRKIIVWSRTVSLYNLEVLVISMCIGFLFLFTLTSVYKSDAYKNEFDSKYVDNVKVTIRDVALMKYAEYKKYRLIENVDMGQLGYVSYIKPNVRENIFRYIDFPKREGKVYFKLFTGLNYNYRYNGWTEVEDDGELILNSIESSLNSNEVEIKSSDKLQLQLYYNKKLEYDEDSAKFSVYDLDEYKILDDEYIKDVYEKYLQIDDENKLVIEKICKEQGFSADSKDLESKIKDYFEKNYIYSTEAINLPFGKDFVNYFLEETKSGNFAHYNSAITLIYRSLGIPARYVGGYALEAEQTMAGSRVGKGKTSTIVKQANMYSWVEVFDKEKGWRIVDLVNAPTLEELKEKYGDDAKNEYTPDTSLESYFSTVDKDKLKPDYIIGSSLKVLMKIICYLLIIFIVVFIVCFGGVKLKRYVEFMKADNSKKAYLIMEKYKRKLKMQEMTYDEIKEVLYKKYEREKVDELISFARKCIFSENVSDEDIKKLKKLVRV